MPHAGYYTFHMDRLRREAGNRCLYISRGRQCPCRSKLEFVHLAPTGATGRGRGMAVRYHDIIKHWDRYSLMCRRHHRAIDGRAFTTVTPRKISKDVVIVSLQVAIEIQRFLDTWEPTAYNASPLVYRPMTDAEMKERTHTYKGDPKP